MVKIRRIISKEEEAKKKRINQIIIGGILVLIMVVSLLGYSSKRSEGEETEKFSYGGFEFVKTAGFWTINMGDLKFSFRYIPNETEQTTETLNKIESYANKPLYLYSENNEASVEIYSNLFSINQIVQRMQEACPEGMSCAKDIPMKKCTDNFIIIRESNSTQIKQQENCVFIEGKKEDLAKLSDSFLFRLIGIQ